MTLRLPRKTFVITGKAAAVTVCCVKNYPGSVTVHVDFGYSTRISLCVRDRIEPQGVQQNLTDSMEESHS
jgi:uncharacterized membrane protein